jgi:hypothetical protein
MVLYVVPWSIFFAKPQVGNGDGLGAANKHSEDGPAILGEVQAGAAQVGQTCFS